MSEELLFVLTFVMALGCGLIAGVFFAFSAFVMKALARLRPAEGIAAMQSINVVVINPIFLGTSGGLLYLLGTIGVTGLFIVPRNELLAVVDPANSDAAPIWADYVRTWTMWNHMRTAAALAAAALLTIVLHR